MAPEKKYWFLLILVLVIGILAGLLLASSLGFFSRTVPQEKVKTPLKLKGDPEIHELMKHISHVFEEASSKVSSSVVSIFAEKVVKAAQPYGMPDDALRDFFGEEFLKRFGIPPQRQEKRTVRSVGSGVIVTEDGYILTNNHVVAQAEKLSVMTGKKKTYEATVIGTDPQTDVAVIKIKARNLPSAFLGNSDEVKVGQWVIAIGNPFHLMHTVTAGIVSAKGRSSVGLADYEDFIQTDASINPGNSGGALVDLHGHVIGINTAITSPSGGNIGIGFAIPINMAKQVMDELVSKGEVIRGYIGLYPQDIDENLAKALKMEGTQGVLVADVARNGPADRSGIKRGDVIIELNKKKVEESTQLRNLVATIEPETPIKVILLRNRKQMEVTVTLGQRREEKGPEVPQEEQLEEQSEQNLGLSIQTLTPGIAQQLGYQNDHGVVIVNVAPGSTAEETGLKRGDLIKEINRTEIRSAQDFEREINNLKRREIVALLVRRGGNTFFLAMNLR